MSASPLPLALVADDDAGGRLLVGEALAQAGFRVTEVGDGAQAVAQFAAQRPEIVLLDVVMPNLDGFEACRRIRALPGGETVPILMLTGLDDVASIAHAYDAGATDFAVKPVNWLVLGQRVRYMLRAKRVFDDLRTSEERLAEAQRIGLMGNWEWEIASGRIRWSDQIYRLLGVEPRAFAPDFERFLEHVHPDDREALRRTFAAAADAGLAYGLDHRLLLAGGGVRHLHVQGEAHRDADGRVWRVTGTVQDITERKLAEEQIRHLAYYDGLTGLPNRLLFGERLAQALATARRQGKMLATLCFDLDRFKRINDTLGHSVGDQLLRAVAERLRRSVRESDLLGWNEPRAEGEALARLGGDEFILAFAEVARVDDVARAARRVQELLAEPFRLGGHEAFVSASIGISVFPHDGDDAEALLKNADTAMYHAKDAGGNQFQFYAQSMNASALERLELENALRRGLERAEFRLHFQPQVDGPDGRVIGAEALVRWHHPELGLVAPGEFIPLAEESGLIVPLGEWVLRAACAQACAWRDAGLGLGRVAVNLSGRQFRQKNLLEVVRRILAESGADPQLIEIEITESVVMQNAEDTVGTLAALKAMGLRLAVDDFGTGYSSLSYLKRFPLDVLKIDRSFIRDVTCNADDAAIAKTIIAMAHSLRLEVVAEGVETAAQAAFLAAHGCQIMQGYLYGRPLPAEEFQARLSVAGAAGRTAPRIAGYGGKP
jgi:diguanylate cyclase (GGDEF)-like protein